MINFITTINNDNNNTANTAVRVLLLTGQSNAEGAALNSSANASELTPTSNVKIWNKNTSTFEDLDIGTNNLAASSASHGMELGISVNFVSETNYDTPLYIIKYADSGTAMSKHLSGGVVYEEFWNNYVKQGINNLINSGKRPFIYMAFSQGEADSNSQNTTDDYSNKFAEWLLLWRGNLGGKLPFNIVEIVESDSLDIQINDVFNSHSSDSYINIIETSGYTTVDGLHYDYDSQKLIANQVLNNIKNQAPIEIKSLI